MHDLLLHASEAIKTLSEIEAIFTQYGIVANRTRVETEGGDLTIRHIAESGTLTLDWHISYVQEGECWIVCVNLYQSSNDIWDVFRSYPAEDEPAWTIGHKPDNFRESTLEESLKELVTGISCDDKRAFTIFAAIAQTLVAQAPSPPTYD